MNEYLNLINEFAQIIPLISHSKVGKKLPNHLYIHTSALPALHEDIQKFEQKVRQHFKLKNDFTLVKFNLQEAKLSYLYYPEFDINPHPSISKSILVNLSENTIKTYEYNQSENPAILHRKETFVTSDYPHYQKFAYLTNIEEKIGLLDNSRYIGTQQKWQQLLQDHNLSFIDHNLVCHLSQNPTNLIEIDRHRAAIVRKNISRPVKLALEAQLFQPESTFFDYGCGHGEDIKFIAEKGYQSDGWDPYYQPKNPFKKADIVNLGYVINVIENLQERRESLLKAWSLTEDILIVSAQVLVDDRQLGLMPYGDGIITERNTFQKYYLQDELKNYIEQILKTEPVAGGLGVYFVFRDETKAHNFRASRFHSNLSAPRIYKPLKNFADYQELLTPLMDFYIQRGRLPIKGEISQEDAIKAEFGTFKRAFRVILQVTNDTEWERIEDCRRQEILLYLALSRFTQRPSVRKLSSELKADIKALFGNYQVACFLADEMLISLRNLELIKKLCQTCEVGKVFDRSFLIHHSVLDQLPTLLRLYESCASRVVGALEGANLIRFYFDVAQIGYLYAPNFNTEKEPMIKTIMTINLKDLRVQYQNFNNTDKAPKITCKSSLQ
ncbi:MAG: DNA phosphorothioation-associated putative methyltransferase [Cyanobacterium sp. T60_A2020_053]|nr:DNA phosphorothioation-associated putative methyltransferase [Cyanobacterium sp. T60_A2020_053]